MSLITQVLSNKASSLIKVVGREQSPLEIEARSNFAVFYQLIAPTTSGLAKVPQDKLLAKHHWKMLDELCTYQSSSKLNLVAGQNTVILMPRNSAKSSITKIWLAWVIGNNPMIRILFLSTVSDLAGSFSLDIQRIIEHNEIFHHVFPEIKPGSPWNQYNWQIDVFSATGIHPEVNYTLSAMGFNSSISGKRSDLIIGDDIITNEDQVNSSEKREQRISKWYNSIEPTLVDGGRILILGTRYHPQDEFSSIFTEKANYRVVRQSAIEVDEHGHEHSYWEEMHPYKVLCEKRARPGGYISFMYQYQNEAIVLSSEAFKHEWIKYTSILPIEDYATLAIGIDLASTVGSKSDYTVMMLCGTTMDGDYHVIDCVRGKWMGNSEKIEQLLLLCEEYDIIKWNHEAPESMGLQFGRYRETDVITYIIPERVAYQESFRGDFDKLVSNELELFNLISQTMKAPRSSKGHRFLGITGAFEHGKVYLNEDRQWQPLISELVGFGSSEHDDMVDALVYALKFLFSRKPLRISSV
jgi:predicted phage terminase large subunit-like protein